MGSKISKSINKKLVAIAQRKIPQLEARANLEQQMSDELDFIDGIAVWDIKEALIAAYELGKKEAKEAK